MSLDPLSEKWIEALCEQLDISLGDIEDAKNHQPNPEELRERCARLKRLYETKCVPGFRSVSRNLDDWLEDAPPAPVTRDAPSAGNVIQGDFSVKESPAVDYSDSRHEHDEPQEERYGVVVKKYLCQEGRVILKSTNSRYAGIEVKATDQFEIKGVVLRIVEGSL